MKLLSLLCLVCLCWTSTALTAAGNSYTENDVRVLNYALTLEHLETAFYKQGLNRFGASEFSKAGYSQQLFLRTQLAAAHEAAHVETLQFLISSLSTTAPVRACVYNFSMVNNISDFLQLAASLESAGAAAYDGVLNRVSDKDLQQLLATIATVEARHAAYFAGAVGQNPFPKAFDETLKPEQVVTAVSQYLVSCPDALQLPLEYGATAAPTQNTTTLGKRNIDLSEGDEKAQTSPLLRRKRIVPDLVNPTPQQVLDNDIATLNYALTLENLEAAFYDYGAAKFKLSDFTAAGYSTSLFAYLSLVGAHERAHVQFLTSVINSLKPFAAVPPCTYNFTQFASLNGFLAGAIIFESTGVKAYDGAVNRLSNDFLQAAASIATVEARHAAYLSAALGQEPFTTVVDSTLTPAQVLAAVTPYLTCPYTPVLPRILLQATTPMANVTSCLESKFLQPGNVEGWSVSGGATVRVAAPAFLEGSNVNTLGADWYFVAPLKYRGNQSMKQTLNFLMSTPVLPVFQQSTSNAADDVVISSTSFELTLALPTLPSTSATPTSYEFSLSPAAGWRIRPTGSFSLGTAATAQQIAQVLQYVACIKIRGKYSLGPHSTYFSDFQLCDGSGPYVVNCPSVNEMECSGRGVCYRGVCTCRTGVSGNSCNSTTRCNGDVRFYFQNQGPNTLAYASRTITGRVTSSSLPTGVPGLSVALYVAGSFFPLTTVMTARDGTFTLTTQFFPDYSYSLRVDGSSLYFPTEINVPSSLSSDFSIPLAVTVTPVTVVF